MKARLQVIIIIFFSITFFSHSQACTRVLFAKPGRAVLVGNNMDWFEDMQTQLIVYPRGIARNGMVNGKALSWKSRYASIVAAAYESITTNGMNERGLAAHFLGLDGSDYGARNENLPGLSIILWAQFYLDNFATVAQAINYTQTHTFQVVKFVHPHLGDIQLHLALEDASGDSAIIEYMNGEPRIYHGKQYTVLTNEPAFDQQLKNVTKYAGLGGDKPLPGVTYPSDRFVRATYYLNHMSDASSDRDAIFKLLSIMQNVEQPFGTPSPERSEGGHIYESVWRSVSDLTHRVYYFNSTTSFNIFWVRLNDFNLRTGAPVMKLDLKENPDLAYDAGKYFIAG